VNKLNRFADIFKIAFRNWIRNDPIREGAVIGYFSIISVPALLVLVINITSVFIDRKDVDQEIRRQVREHINPATATQLEETVERAGEIEGGIPSTILGILIILFGATRVFIHLQRSFNLIWEVKVVTKKFFRRFMETVFSIGLILCIGFLLLVSMALSAFLAAAGSYFRGMFPSEIIYVFYVIEFLVSTGLIWLLFTMMFRYLPDVIVPWKSAMGGSLVTTSLFMVLKYGLSAFFSGVEPGSVYGAAGAIVLVMLWFSVASMIVFLGAEFSKSHASSFNLNPSPKKGAKLKGHNDQ
jgi:membrane protein